MFDEWGREEVAQRCCKGDKFGLGNITNVSISSAKQLELGTCVVVLAEYCETFIDEKVPERGGPRKDAENFQQNRR